jgi:hypothetical protein
MAGPLNDNLNRLRDAKMLADAMRRSAPGTREHDFVSRIRRSFHQWGSLTPAMRHALNPSLITASSS